MVALPEYTEAEKKFHALQCRALDIQDELKRDIPVVNGELDFSEYDELHARLREVNAEMASCCLR